MITGNVYVDFGIWVCLFVWVTAIPCLAFIQGVRHGMRVVQQRPGVTASSNGRVELTATEEKEPKTGKRNVGPLPGYADITEAARR